MLYDLDNRILAHFKIVIRQSVFFLLLIHQVNLRDLDLLQFRIPGKVDDFHPVQQRRQNIGCGIGRADKQSFGQIVFHLDVVVHEKLVLLRVQYFQQCGRRIAHDAIVELVDFIHQDHRIGAPGFAHGLNDFSGQCPDIGAAVPANFRLVPDSAQTHPSEIAAQGAGDGFCQGCFPDSRRADKAQDRPLQLAFQLAHRQEFDDPFLDLLHSIVIFVQHGF